jgi:hypothetical protein
VTSQLCRSCPVMRSQSMGYCWGTRMKSNATRAMTPQCRREEIGVRNSSFVRSKIECHIFILGRVRIIVACTLNFRNIASRNSPIAYLLIGYSAGSRISKSQRRINGQPLPCGSISALDLVLQSALQQRSGLMVQSPRVPGLLADLRPCCFLHASIDTLALA